MSRFICKSVLCCVGCVSMSVCVKMSFFFLCVFSFLQYLRVCLCNLYILFECVLMKFLEWMPVCVFLFAVFIFFYFFFIISSFLTVANPGCFYRLLNFSCEQFLSEFSISVCGRNSYWTMFFQWPPVYTALGCRPNFL